MQSSAGSAGRKKRQPQRAVPTSVRRSGKPLFFGWGAHLTHHEREQVKERLAAAIGIVIALSVIGILGWGWYTDNIQKPNQRNAANNAPAAIVGGTTITKGYYDKVVKYQQQSIASQLQNAQNQQKQLQASKSPKAQAALAQINAEITQIKQQQSNVQDNVLQELIAYEVIRQKGPKSGLKLTPAGENAFYHNVVYNQVGGPKSFAKFAQGYGLTVAEMRGLVLDDYARQQMQKVLAAKVKTVQPQVHARHILVADKKTAKKVRQLLVAHKGTWQELAKAYSKDPGSKSKGGDLGWQTKGTFVGPFDKAAFTQPIGSITIVHSSFGYHVIQVLGRRQHKLSKAEIATAKTNALQTWLTNEEAAKGYVIKKISTTQVPLPQTSPPGLAGSSAGLPTGANGAPVSGAPAGSTGSGAPAGPAAPSVPGKSSGSSSTSGSNSGASSGKSGANTGKSGH